MIFCVIPHCCIKNNLLINIVCWYTVIECKKTTNNKTLYFSSFFLNEVSQLNWKLYHDLAFPLCYQQNTLTYSNGVYGTVFSNDPSYQSKCFQFLGFFKSYCWSRAVLISVLLCNAWIAPSWYFSFIIYMKKESVDGRNINNTTSI